MSAKNLTTKGGNYGVGPARRGGAQTAGLKSNISQLLNIDTGSGPQPASGVLKKWDRRRPTRPAKVRLVANKRWHKMVSRRHRLGLTSRGTIPKRRPNVKLTEDGLAFGAMKILRGKIDLLAVAINRTFDHLTPEGKAAAISLSHELTEVRKELV